MKNVILVFFLAAIGFACKGSERRKYFTWEKSNFFFQHTGGKQKDLDLQSRPNGDKPHCR